MIKVRLKSFPAFELRLSFFRFRANLHAHFVWPWFIEYRPRDEREREFMTEYNNVHRECKFRIRLFEFDVDAHPNKRSHYVEVFFLFLRIFTGWQLGLAEKKA